LIASSEYESVLLGLRTLATDALLKVVDLSQGWVLAAGAEKIAELVEDDTADAARVEERESLLVVRRSLSVAVVRDPCVLSCVPHNTPGRGAGRLERTG
jgi:hypothetical protein